MLYIFHLLITASSFKKYVIQIYEEFTEYMWLDWKIANMSEFFCERPSSCEVNQMRRSRFDGASGTRLIWLGRTMATREVMQFSGWVPVTAKHLPYGPLIQLVKRVAARILLLMVLPVLLQGALRPFVPASAYCRLMSSEHVTHIQYVDSGKRIPSKR